MLVNDVEADARGRDIYVQPPAPEPPAVDPGAADAGSPPAPLPLPEPVLTHVVVPFEGKLETGAVSHVSAALALAARTSPAAKRLVEASPSMFCTNVERLLRLTRPFSFTVAKGV